MQNENTYELPVKFGEYDLFHYIGKGGMAEIFLARNSTGLGTQKLVVIKRILPNLNRNKDFCEMLINEAKICSGLSNANIVSTYQLGQIDEQYYIAMEYVEGIDLNKLLATFSKQQKKIPLEYSLFIAVQVLKGLDYAHRVDVPGMDSTGIIHRDVSPTNVLVSKEGEVKLCDFGIAKVAHDAIDTDDKTVDEDHIKGKVAYMAPEHISGQNIDTRADLYTVGILIWELLNGKRLFKSKNPDETLKKATAAIVPSIEECGFPEFELLDAIVKKSLAKDVNVRFQDGKSFIRAIEDYIQLIGRPVSMLQFGTFLKQNMGEVFDDLRQSRVDGLTDLDEKISATNIDNQTEDDQNTTIKDSFWTDEDEEESLKETQKGMLVSDIISAKFDNEHENASENKSAKSSKTTLLISIVVVLLAIVLIYKLSGW